jgi:hypothetical protein
MTTHLITTTRLHLLLALVAALTGTTYGLVVAAAVLATTTLRTWTRHQLEGPALRSVPVGARVLAPLEHAQVLDAAGGPRERLAG